MTGLKQGLNETICKYCDLYTRGPKNGGPEIAGCQGSSSKLIKCVEMLRNVWIAARKRDEAMQKLMEGAKKAVEPVEPVGEPIDTPNPTEV
jgi:hypothetical protein